MKICKLPSLSRGLFIPLAALALAVGFSLSAQAVTCTTGNWTATVGGVVASTQNPSNNHRRYGGPCGGRFEVDGTEAYVHDGTPGVNGEPSYIVRFYVFLDDAGNGPITLFEADDDTNPRIVVEFENGNLKLMVLAADNSTVHTISFDDVGSGWHSVELVWEADASAEILFSVNGATDESVTVDTGGTQITNARLGNVNGADGGSFVNFDDFVSNRASRPGRLCRGLTEDENTRDVLAFADMDAIFIEMATAGGNPAGGQPDYNEDGEISFADMDEIFIRMATGNEACDLNR